VPPSRQWRWVGDVPMNRVFPVESREDIGAGAEEIVDISEPGEETEPAPI